MSWKLILFVWLKLCKNTCAPQSECTFPNLQFIWIINTQKASSLLILKCVVWLAVMLDSLPDKFKCILLLFVLYYFAVESVKIHKINWIQFSVPFAFMQRFCVCSHYRELRNFFSPFVWKFPFKFSILSHTLDTFKSIM